VSNIVPHIESDSPLAKLRRVVLGVILPRTSGMVNLGDRILYSVTRLFALFIILLAALLVIEMLTGSWEALAKFGVIGFTTGTTWDPVFQVFGTAPTIVATIYKAILSLIIAVPISLGTAIYLALYAPDWLRTPISYLVETLAAIPSVIIGLWGLFVLVPIVRTVQVWLFENHSWFPWFNSPNAYFGVGIFAGGLVLAIMIIPIISAISRDLIRAVPREQMEALLALGATKWEAIWKVVLPHCRVGLIGAVGLGLGRSIGETMAVAMVGGNAFRMPATLFDPVHSMASKISSEFAEATYSLYLSSLFAVGLTLFVITIIVNLLAHVLVWRITRGERGGGFR